MIQILCSGILIAGSTQTLTHSELLFSPPLFIPKIKGFLWLVVLFYIAQKKNIIAAAQCKKYETLHSGKSQN